MLIPCDYVRDGNFSFVPKIGKSIKNKFRKALKSCKVDLALGF